MFESRRARHLIELKRVRRIALHLDRLPTNQTLYPTENYGWTAQLSPHQAIHSQRQVSAAHRLSVWYVRRHQLGVANENTGVQYCGAEEKYLKIKCPLLGTPQLK